jgi:ABC-2 type transport system permease protein
MGRVARAYPTLLRVGVADMVAYRSEFFIWVLTMNLPLVNLAVWNAVVEDGAVGRFGRPQFIAYYLSTMMVRLLTSNWVMWELVMAIRQGTLSMRLMRPIHPLIAYSAEQLAAVPLRLFFVAPVLGALLWSAGEQVTMDPARLAIFAAAMVGSWLMQFFLMVMMGLLSFWMESTFALFEVWMAVNGLLSGYWVPLELFPSWLQDLGAWMPFKYLLAFPVETLLGMQPLGETLFQLGVQWTYVAVITAFTLWLWRVGVKRFSAFGG